jgi:UMF1 family MFS transporter
MKRDNKTLLGWYFYDWANSAFVTAIVTVFMGPFITALAEDYVKVHGALSIFGMKLHPGSLFPLLVSVSVIFQVLVLPILGAIADSTNSKKRFLTFFAVVGTVFTSLMYFIPDSQVLLLGVAFIVANLSFGASIVFYNAYLPEIASNGNHDTISANGWAFGYLGGGLHLGICLALFSNAQSLGLTTGQAVRLAMLSAGVWWGVFSVVSLIMLPKSITINQIDKNTSLLKSGISQLLSTIKDLRNYPQTLLFLVAFFLYNDGIQTVIAMASTFGAMELKLSVSTLTTVILMVQFIAIVGSIGFKYIAIRLSTKTGIIISLVGWTIALTLAYTWVNDEQSFYLLAVLIAIVLGGSQALSRSLFSRIIPQEKASEFFSFYELTDKGTTWIGTMFFAFALQFSNSYRLAIVSLLVFFIFGIVLVSFVDVKKALKDVQSNS